MDECDDCGEEKKKGLGNYIVRNEGMNMDESGEIESVELEFYMGNDDENDVYIGQWHSQMLISGYYYLYLML